MRGCRTALTLAVAVALLALEPVVALGYSRTGSDGKVNVYGEFYWCEPDFCEWWYGYANGFTSWNAVFEHSEGTSEYDVAPFQQDALLQDGRELYADGLYPHAARSADIFNRAGTRIISNFRNTTNSPCYSSANSSADIVWSGCAPYGFIIPTGYYPPGSERSYVNIYDSFASYGWVFNYSGTLY